MPTITNPAEMEEYIVPPVAGDAAGLMGALQVPSHRLSSPPRLSSSLPSSLLFSSPLCSSPPPPLQLGLMARNAAPAAGLGQVLAKKRAMLASANPCVLMCVAAAAGALAMHLAKR